MRTGGIEPLVHLKRNSRNEVEEELAAQVLETIANLRADWHAVVVDAELTSKERARLRERLDPFYLPKETQLYFERDHKRGGRKQLAVFRNIFAHVDEDGSREIDKQELILLLHAVGENPAPDKLTHMINAVDSERTGTVSFREFVCFVQDLREEVRVWGLGCSAARVCLAAAAAAAAVDVRLSSHLFFLSVQRTSFLVNSVTIGCRPRLAVASSTPSSRL